MITDQLFLKEINVNGFPFIVEAQAGIGLDEDENKIIDYPCTTLYAVLKMKSGRPAFFTARVQQGINESVASLEARLILEIEEQIKTNKLEFDLYRELFKNGFE